MAQETFIIGDSEGMEAEYSERADAPVSVIGFYDGQSFVFYGAQTIAAAKRKRIVRLIAGKIKHKKC